MHFPIVLDKKCIYQKIINQFTFILYIMLYTYNVIMEEFQDPPKVIFPPTL